MILNLHQFRQPPVHIGELVLHEEIVSKQCSNERIHISASCGCPIVGDSILKGKNFYPVRRSYNRGNILPLLDDPQTAWDSHGFVEAQTHDCKVSIHC